jgi:hypothetical protein
MSEPFLMRAKCKNCEYEQGYIETKNGQDCVYCGNCERHQYNAPKTETGRDVRKMDTGRTNLTPSHRARIFERDNCRCVLCGNRERLEIGHLLSGARDQQRRKPCDHVHGVQFGTWR